MPDTPSLSLIEKVVPTLLTANDWHDETPGHAKETCPVCQVEIAVTPLIQESAG
jgi:hypothetical protein